MLVHTAAECELLCFIVGRLEMNHSFVASTQQLRRWFVHLFSGENRSLVAAVLLLLCMLSSLGLAKRSGHKWMEMLGLLASMDLMLHKNIKYTYTTWHTHLYERWRSSKVFFTQLVLFSSLVVRSCYRGLECHQFTYVNKYLANSMKHWEFMHLLILCTILRNSPILPH